MMSETDPFSNQQSQTGETVEQEDDPKWSLGHVPEPQTGETVIYSGEQIQQSELPKQDEGVE